MTTQAFTDSGYDYFEIVSSDALVAAVPQQAGVNLGLKAPAGFWTAVDTDGDDIHITNSAGTLEYALRLVNWNKAGNTGWAIFDGQGISASADTTLRVYVTSAAAARPAATGAYTNPEYFTLDSDLEGDTAPDNSPAACTLSETGTVTSDAALIANGIELDGSTEYLEYLWPVPTYTASDQGEIPDAGDTGEANTGIALHPTLNSGSPAWIIAKYHSTASNSEILVYNLARDTLLDSLSISYQPQGVAVDANGYVWVADLAGDQVYVYDPASSWATQFSSPLAVTAAQAICYRSSTNQIYVGDSGGTFDILDATDGSADGTLSANNSGAVDGATVRNDQLWLSNQSAAIDVIRFSDGSRFAEFNCGLAEPEHIAFYNDELYINNDAEFHGGTPAGNRLWKISAADIAEFEDSWPFWGSDDFTYRIVAEMDAVSGTDAIMAHNNAVTGIGFGLFATTTTNLRPFIRDNAANRVFADRTITAGRRVLHVVVNRTSDVMQLYADGAKVSTDIDISSVTGYVHVYSIDFGIGASPNGDAVRHFDGMLDQAMLRRGAMSANEISTEYNWMTNQASFWTAGSWSGSAASGRYLSLLGVGI